MAKKLPSRPFSRWTIDSVHELGKLQRQKQHKSLNEWLESTTSFTPEEKHI